MDVETLKLWIEPAVVLAVAVVLGFVVQAVFVRQMGRLSQRTKTEVDDLLVRAVHRHVPLWFTLAGLAAAVRVDLALLTDLQRARIDKLVVVLAILSLSFVAANLLTSIVERKTAHAGASSIVSSSLMRNVLRGAILVVGGLMILSELDVRIEPLLTALGVGSLAVALALQPTLSNLFAGLHITLAKPLRIGDFVELENGIQGFVVDIDWRTTKLREGANNLVVVPNARLVEMIARNYSLPQPEQSFTVVVGVGYGSDLERVERITLEVAREVQASAPHGVRDFEPVVRVQALGPSSIDLLVVLRGAAVTDKGELVHELLKRLKARYDREGIEIPFPQHVVHMAGASRPT